MQYSAQNISTPSKIDYSEMETRGNYVTPEYIYYGQPKNYIRNLVRFNPTKCLNGSCNKIQYYQIDKSSSTETHTFIKNGYAKDMSCDGMVIFASNYCLTHLYEMPIYRGTGSQPIQEQKSNDRQDQLGVLDDDVCSCGSNKYTWEKTHSHLEVKMCYRCGQSRGASRTPPGW